MKIELTKKITIKKIEFIGEINFFKESPYINLLEKFSTKTELLGELESKGLSESAINNIISKLEKLGVIEYGDITTETIKNGFPEREYGKYSLEFFENSDKFPFKTKNREIKRENANGNISNSIKSDKYLIEKIYKKSENFSDDTEFKIIDITSNKYREVSSKEVELRLEFIDNKWKYIIENRKFSMDEIPLSNLFLGAWSLELNALKIQYDWLKNDDSAINNFMWSFPVSEYKIKDYGNFKSDFQNIPIIPQTKSDALQWLLYLLQQKIEKENRYISKDELHWLWNNILDDKPQLDYFDLEFNFEEVLKKFGRGSKYYWLLQSSIDLYPFDTNLTPKDRVIIQSENSIDLNSDFMTKFNIKIPKELTIVDRWIVDLKQFQGLEKVIEAFGNPKIKIITQDVYNNLSQNKRDKIEEIIENNNIQRIVKEKNEIVHSRYWIFDNKRFYKTNNSLDVIKIDEENISIKEQTTFDLYDKDDLEPELMNLLEEL